MKIVLSTLNAKFIHSSLALRYLRSYAEASFPDIELVEYTINDVLLNIVGDLHKRKPDLIAFSCYIWNIQETLAVVRNLKKILPDVPVILGGPEVSYDTDFWLKEHPYIDAIVMGEGEQTFLELCQAYDQAQRTGEPAKLSEVNGIGYLEGEVVRFTFPRKQIEDLNQIPSPYEKHLDELKNRVVYFEASRGCPFSCQYCLSSIEVGVRYFDVERVKRDLKRLVDHGIKTVKFVDRTFNIHKRYAMDVFQFLIANHNGTVFQFEITADILKPDVVDFLAEHAPPGIFRFEIGVQSTNDETNRLVHRRQNFEKLSYTVKKIKDSGKIDQHLDLIAGLPEEDYASFRETFNDVFALRPEELQLGFLKMLRGTGVRARAANHGYIYMDESPYEILGNNVLPFSDIQRIKRTEDILEKYWNAHRMDHTIEWLITREFETPFDFFQEFGDYWEEQGWNRFGHQLEDLFTRLKHFLGNRETSQLHHVTSLLKFDFLQNNKHRPRKIWWEDKLDKAEGHSIFIQLQNKLRLLREDFAQHAVVEKEFYKHTMMTDVSFDLVHYFVTGEVREGEYVLIVYYSYNEGRDNTYTVVPKPKAVSPTN